MGKNDMGKIAGKIENGWTMVQQPEVFILRQGQYEAMVSESDEEEWAFDWSIDLANDYDDEDDDEFNANFVARGICRGKTDDEAKEQAMTCVRALLDVLSSDKPGVR